MSSSRASRPSTPPRPTSSQFADRRARPPGVRCTSPPRTRRTPRASSPSSAPPSRPSRRPATSATSPSPAPTWATRSPSSGCTRPPRSRWRRRAPPRIASASRPSGRWRCTTSGWSTRDLGRLDEAKEVEQRAVESFARQSDPRLEGASRVYLARILPRVRRPRGRRARGAGGVHGDEAPRRVEGRRPRGFLGARSSARATSPARARGRAGCRERSSRAARDRRVGELRAGVTVVEALDAAGERALARAALERALASIALRASRLRNPATIASLIGIPEHARTLALAASWGVEPPRVPLRREPAP